MLGGLLGGGVQVNNEDINGRSFPYLCICPSAPKAKRPVYSPLVPSSLSLTGLFPRQDQPSPAQPFFPLIHSSNCCCPSRPGGTHGNFSPHWTLPPLPVLSWERNCIMALGSIRPPFKGMESFSVGLIQGHPLPCLHLR